MSSKPRIPERKKETSSRFTASIRLDDLMLDLEEHYRRISGIAKSTPSDDKSFPKTYVILKDLAKALVEIIKLRGIEQDEQHIFDLLQRLRKATKRAE